MQKQVIKAQTKMEPALHLGYTSMKTALIALIKDLTVPSDFVYGYFWHPWGLERVGVEFALEIK